jgi:hypothetical protein
VHVKHHSVLGIPRKSIVKVKAEDEKERQNSEHEKSFRNANQ